MLYSMQQDDCDAKGVLCGAAHALSGPQKCLCIAWEAGTMALAAHGGRMAALKSTARLFTLVVLSSVQTGVVTQGQAPAGLVTNQCKTQQVQRCAMRPVARHALSQDHYL